LIEQKPVVEQVLDPNLAYVMTDLMTGMFDIKLDNSVTGRSVTHLVRRPIAGKSGTTLSDSWMIGYTPQLVAGVWTGHDKGNLEKGEAQYAKRIWANFLEDSLNDNLKLPFPKPGNVVAMTINPDTGRLATDACPVQHVSYFVKGTEPVEYCQEHIPNPSSTEKEEIAEIEEAKKEKFLDRFMKWVSGGE
jgi:penicillin-binding protein 2D